MEGAANLGMASLALTDRDTLAGVPRLLKACADAGVSPIVGAEITVATHRETGCAKGRGHVVLLALSERGYRAMARLMTDYLCRPVREDRAGSWPSAKERRNPLCGLDTLLEYASTAGGGLICLTGAIPFGLLPDSLLDTGSGGANNGRSGADRSGAVRVLKSLREAFGGDNVYVELTDDETHGSRSRMRELEILAEGCGRSDLPRTPRS